MNNSALTPRASLLAKSRKHFVGFAASGLILTGALTAGAAQAHSTNNDSSTGSGAVTGSTGNTNSTTTDNSTNSGITPLSGASSSSHNSNDGSSNAS